MSVIGGAEQLERPIKTVPGSGATNKRTQPSGESKTGRWIARAGFALIDQGLVSGSNFVVSIVLARWLSTEQYGAFALVFAVFLLLSMAYQCLLLEPMAIYGAGEYRSRLRGYLGSLGAVHFIISGTIFALLTAASLAVRWLSNAGDLAGALAGIAVAAPCTLTFWLARRTCYLDARSGAAAGGAVFYCASMMGGLWVAHASGALSPFTAFLIMGLSGLLTAIILAFVLNGSIAADEHPSPSPGETWRRHWRYGGWALAGAVASWIPAYIYYPLLGSFAGLSSVASLKALMNLAAPVTQLQAAFSMLLIPYATRRFRQRGHQGVVGFGKLLTWCGFGCATAYWLLIYAFKGIVLGSLYGGKYPQVAALLPLAAIGSIFWTATFGFSIALRAMERPRLIFIGFGISAVVSLLVGLPATRMAGLNGAIWGINISDIAAFVLLTIAIMRMGRTEDQGDSSHAGVFRSSISLKQTIDRRNSI